MLIPTRAVWGSCVATVTLALLGVVPKADASVSWTDIGAPAGTNLGPRLFAVAVGGTTNNVDNVDFYAVDSTTLSVWVRSYGKSVFGPTFFPWTRLGPQVNSGPTAVAWPNSNGTTHREVVIFGTDGAAWHQSTDSSSPTTGWSGWRSIGHPPTTMFGCGVDPGAVSWGPGRIDVFGVGCDSGLWHTCSGSGCTYGVWDQPTGLGLNPLTTPVAISNAPGTLDVFVQDSSGATYDVNWNGTRWSTVNTGLPVNPLSASATPTVGNQMAAFALGSQGTLLQGGLSTVGSGFWSVGLLNGFSVNAGGLIPSAKSVFYGGAEVFSRDFSSYPFFIRSLVWSGGISWADTTDSSDAPSVGFGSDPYVAKGANNIYVLAGAPTGANGALEAWVGFAQ